MSKVIKCNVILRGREFKAGTKESDLPGDVKKDAAKFLIDEKKYKAAGQPEAIIDTKAQEHITGLEALLSTQEKRADTAEEALSQANSDIAGLTSQLEDAVTAEDIETAVEAEKQRADDAEEKLEEAKILLGGMEKQISDLKKAAKK